MNSTIAVFIMILSALLASISQVMLKKSSQIKYDNVIREYLNFYVIFGYGLLFFTMLINIVAYQYLPYKLGPVINTLSYIFVFILSKIVFKEKLTRNKLLGMICIIIGVLVFNLNAIIG